MHSSTDTAFTRSKLTITLLVVAFFILALWGLYGGDTIPAYASVFPPLLAICVALITRHVIGSLMLGVLAGGLLSVGKEATNLGDFVFLGGKEISMFLFSSITTSWNIQVLLFLVFILCAISVMIYSGALRGVIAWLAPYAKTRRSAQFIAYLMGLLMFIDDYANAALVGSSMRSIFDKYKISREKLSFIVDSTSAPIAGIAFVSTWIGYEVGQIGQVAHSMNLSLDGYGVFFDVFRYRYYCIFMLFFVLINIFFAKEFSVMHKAETDYLNNIKNNAVDSSVDGELNPVPHAVENGWGAVIPITTMLGFFILGLWFDGGGATIFAEAPSQILHFSVWRDVISSAQHNMLILMLAGLICLIMSISFAKFLAKLHVKDILFSIQRGFVTALLPLTILVLAWSLKAACDVLHTDSFIVSFFSHGMSPILFPLVTFILAAITALATGTSWGTMAILLPMVMPLGISLDGDQYGLYTMLAISAVLDGSIFGDHSSPISDTTVMSSISSGCNHISHVLTQAPYAFVVGMSALILGYLFTGLGGSIWLSYSLAIVVFIGIFSFVAKALPNAH